MPLTNLIDLIAEVAAKRIAREGETKAETPNGMVRRFPALRASLWSEGHIFSGFSGKMRGLDSPGRPAHS